jgi:cholesterol oxidase
MKTSIRPPNLGAQRIGQGADQRIQVMYDMPLGYPRRFVLVPVLVDESAPGTAQVQAVLPPESAPAVPGLERGCYVNGTNLDADGSYTEAVSPAQWPEGGNHTLLLLYFDQRSAKPAPADVVREAVALLADPTTGSFNHLRTGLLPHAGAARKGPAQGPETADPREPEPAGPLPPLRFVVASCQYPHDVLDRTPDPSADGGYEPGPPDRSMMALAQVFKGRFWPRRDPQAPSVLVLCGDQVYVDATAGLFDPTTLYDRFRRPYTLIRQSRGAIELQRYQPSRIHRLVDDHEIDDSWTPGDDDQQATYGRLGAEAYFEIQRASLHPPRVPPQGPMPQADEQASYGSTDFFFGDTRLHREMRSAADYRAKSILGAEQELRLHNWLRQGTAPPGTARVIATPSMLLPRPLAVRDDEHAALHCDSWCGYPQSLHALLALIARERLAGLVFVSGDEHLSGVATITLHDDQGHLRATLWSVHSSPMYAPYPFANADAAEFECDQIDSFDFCHRVDAQAAAEIFTCRVGFELAPAGDGFAVVTMAPDGSDRPFSVSWHRPPAPPRA